MNKNKIKAEIKENKMKLYFSLRTKESYFGKRGQHWKHLKFTQNQILLNNSKKKIIIIIMEK